MDGFLQDELKTARRQELDTYYRFNGAIYLSRVAFFEQNHDIYREGCFAYVMDKRSSVDIDDEIDFMLCEAILKQ